MADHKFCYKCSNLKKLDEFSKDKTKGDGHSTVCKECKNKVNLEWRKSEAARRENVNGCILAFGDDQAPANHPDEVEFLRLIKQVYKPKRVVHMGDEIDANMWSSYLRDPDGVSANTELDQALENLHKIYNLFPKADVLRSNHVDQRFEKKRQESGFISRCVRPIEDILDMPNGWKRHTELFIDNVLFRHGHKDRKAMKSTLQERIPSRYDGFYSMVMGHHHESFGRSTPDIPVGRNRYVWGAHSGCLVNKHHPYMQYGPGYEKLGCLIILHGVPISVSMETDNDFRWTGRLINAYNGQVIAEA